MTETSTFKILAIDGGGVKGLYSSTMLESFEDQFGQNCSDTFDMICGTSTGGLIALALSLKIPAHQITKMYLERSPEIFPTKSKWERLARQVMWRGIHTDFGLKRVLNDLFAERRIAESHNLLCVPSFSFTEFRPVVFRHDHSGLYRHNDLKYVDVALATSAAPTYLPMAEIDNYDFKQMIDGGVWANNPALVGLTEALRYFVGPGKQYSHIQLLSIPSLGNRNGNPIGLRRNKSFIDWRDDLIETSLTGQAYFTNFFLEKVSQINGTEIEYYRIPASILSAEQERIVTLDNTSVGSLKLMQMLGKETAAHEIHNNPFVKKVFSNLKSYNTQNG